MTLRLDLWRVDGSRLVGLPAQTLDIEQRLEGWIDHDPSILGMDLLIIGRQVMTPYSGRVDLLALDGQANTVVLELKRGRTPRDVVGQVLDYASWVKDLSYEDLDRLCVKHRGSDLATAFQQHFDQSVPDSVNDDHQLVIVAPELDDSSERIVTYLAEERGLAINVVFFNVFKLGDTELIGRAWLKDPVEIEEKTGSKRRAPWQGYWFVNVGEGPHRTWADNARYGFIAAGQGEKYSGPLKKLNIGDQILAYVKGKGYVGYGVVKTPAQMIKDVRVNGTPLLDLELQAERPGENADDPTRSEWVVLVEWKKTFPTDQAQTFKGVFANQNIVCKLRDPLTVDFVQRQFNILPRREVSASPHLLRTGPQSGSPDIG
jgi:hypothetical protein